MPPAVLFRADVVCPMAGPPLADGGVLVVGDRVAAVGPAADLRGQADREHHVTGVLLPGLVNAHAHLEYTDAASLAQPGPFHLWVRALIGMTSQWAEERWGRSAHRGVLSSLRAGTTTLFDVVPRGPAVPAAARAGLTGDSFVEVVMVDDHHADSVLQQVVQALALPAEGRRVGIAPHAPYTLGTQVLRRLAALARRSAAPLHVHLAETQSEVAAVRDGAGPFADRARELGMAFEWLDGTGLSPVRYADAAGALYPGASVAHGVWVDMLEARLLAERGVTVVCCPRSNTLLQAGDAPLERYAQAGTALALGTDSAASAPDLDVLAEAAAWAALARRREMAVWPSRSGPVELAEQAVRLATVDGAAAMGWGASAGVLASGRRADMVGVALQTTPAAVYRDLLERGAGRQVLTVLGGVRKARRDDPDQPWPDLDDDAWRARP